MKTIVLYIKNFILNLTKFNCKNCKHSYVSEKTGVRRCSIHQCCHGCDKRVSDKDKCKDYKRRSE